MSRYDYEELRAAAVENPTFENMEALADWLENYNMSSWNGEYFDIDDGLRLYPIYGAEDEDGCFPIIDYKIA